MNVVRILIVENSQSFIQVVSEFFKTSGYDFLAATNGIDAIKVIGESSPDLVLMDLYMSGMNGDECCKKIKSNPSTKGVPVIIVTPSDKAEDIEKCKNSGCDDYITKPVSMISLIKKLKQFLPIPPRRYKRAPMCTTVKYYFGDQEYAGVIFSISEGGLFIKGEKVLEKESKVRVIFDIPQIAKHIEIEGKVVWDTNERDQIPGVMSHGFGMEFLSIDEKGAEAIKTYVGLGDYIS